jgi:hypothetical protein
LDGSGGNCQKNELYSDDGLEGILDCQRILNASPVAWTLGNWVDDLSIIQLLIAGNQMSNKFGAEPSSQQNEEKLIKEIAFINATSTCEKQATIIAISSIGFIHNNASSHSAFDSQG